MRRGSAAILLSLLAAFGVLAAPAPAQLSIAAGVIEESQSAAPAMVATLQVTAATTRRVERRRRGVFARLARTARSWPVRTWRFPVMVVGGVPPGRAPPLATARC